MTGAYIWLLLRRLTENESLFFPIVVEVEEDEPALFGAGIHGLEAQIAAMGRSTEEAMNGAIDLFTAMVDNAIENRIPLTDELPNLTFSRLPIDVDTAAKGLSSILKMIRRDDEEEWRFVPTTILAASEAVPA